MKTSKNIQELLEKFKKIIKVSQRITKAEVARYLGISEFELVSFIADLGDDLPVKIDGNDIIINDFNDFVDYIDKQFDTWSDMEKLKKGKLESSFEGGTNQTAFSIGMTSPSPSVGMSSNSSATNVKKPKPEWRKKYDFNLKLGNAAIKNGKLDVALDRFRSALDVAEDNYDADLTLEAGRLVEQVEKLKAEREQQKMIQVVQAKLDSARASYDSGNLDSALAEFKTVKSECERLGYRDGMQAADDYIAKIEAKLPKDYHGIKLVAREYDVMVELERLVGERIPQVSKVEWNTFGFVAENGHVVQLGLYKKGLTSLPETIGNLKSLQELYLHENKLTSLPETIGNLTSLKELWLYENKLTSLPETIGNLTNLKELYLWSNNLTSLPETLWQLTGLKVLGLGGNNLTSLPETIGNLKSLQTLDLTFNSLTSLPETLWQLTGLKVLGLGGNNLTSLPETIGQLKNLIWLHLGFNSLTSLPETIGQLKNLEILNLNENQLRSLPETLERWIRDLKSKGCTVYR